MTGGPSSAGSEISQLDWENIGIMLDALHEAWEILHYSLRNEDKDLLADKQIWLISKIIPQFLHLELGGAILDAPNARLWGRYYRPPRLGPPTSARPDDCWTESDADDIEKSEFVKAMIETWTKDRSTLPPSIRDIQVAKVDLRKVSDEVFSQRSFQKIEVLIAALHMAWRMLGYQSVYLQKDKAYHSQEEVPSLLQRQLEIVIKYIPKLIPSSLGFTIREIIRCKNGCNKEAHRRKTYKMTVRQKLVQKIRHVRKLRFRKVNVRRGPK